MLLGSKKLKVGSSFELEVGDDGRQETGALYRANNFDPE
jgi:hypothetical protein